MRKETPHTFHYPCYIATHESKIRPLTFTKSVVILDCKYPEQWWRNGYESFRNTQNMKQCLVQSGPYPLFYFYTNYTSVLGNLILLTWYCNHLANRLCSNLLFDGIISFVKGTVFPKIFQPSLYYLCPHGLPVFLRRPRWPPNVLWHLPGPIISVWALVFLWGIVSNLQILFIAMLAPWEPWSRFPPVVATIRHIACSSAPKKEILNQLCLQ